MRVIRVINMNLISTVINKEVISLVVLKLILNEHVSWR